MSEVIRSNVVAALVDAYTQLDEQASTARLWLVEGEHQPTTAERAAAMQHEAVHEMPTLRAEAELVALMAARRHEGGIARRMFPGGSGDDHS